ncbi:precorrin-6y C5,15-methyltransferase (decarboxylating) subunit CbiE [Cyanobium sp. HWJ4-Hawea]|uniref:precorrin-6y C5,15-methyltransferase (decarboxylating) subunit CbiE n=1 Tax=Cyanobium sp. HWJ4-Hawea TaxID=2823713 RepID=UPI0020CBE1BB|nr:precorrin-6y C5,15-methyltransferase (decarboxylating) subunit CbiE [Cyanobium sp. HWJ4-Hawea]MCP9808034.1 precorrin-6y C5,15-methyltransferase (decarboxylating) subunit CbiE [Cyanobium sp. HWJ4-Hawea]
MTIPDSAGCIDVVGCDASGLASLNPELRSLVERAQLVAAPSRLLAQAELAGGPGAAWISSDQPQPLIAALQQALAAGRAAVVLASGDPLWFGIGRVLLQTFGADQLRFHPAPSSLQLAFARIGRAWQDASWVSLHGRDPEPLALALQGRPPALAVLTDPGRGGAQAVRQILRASGLEAAYGFWLCERLGHPQERVQRLSAAAPLPQQIDPLHLVLLIAEAPAAIEPAALPLFGLDDGLWLQLPDRPGLMTKREVRIQLLADLALPAQGVLWDIGAGVGSIGLEALRLRPELQLWALESRGGSAGLIAANAGRLGVEPAGIREARAPDGLADLPDPDRVVIGGGGEGRSAILLAVLERLRPKGVVVIPLATVEALGELRSVMDGAGMEVKVAQHQAWRGAPLAGGTRLAPLNPVFVLRGERA